MGEPDGNPGRHAPVRVAVVCAIDLSVKALLRPQIQAMIDRGYNVRAVCSDGPLVPELRRGGLTVETVPILRRVSPWADLKAVRKLARLFRRRQIDIVHTHTPKAAFLGQVAARLARVPIRINTVHGFYYFAEPPGLKRWLFKTLEIRACRLATHVLSQSREDVDLAVREGFVPAEKLEWLGNGVDVDLFKPDRFAPDDRAAVRRELDIPEDAFVVGIVARMVREKGIAELFQAFAHLRQVVPNAHLLHIGFVDRSRADEITPDLADSMGIRQCCRFMGLRDDVPRLMTAMDVYCLPSYREGYPRSVMEASAMGLPAIVTDIRGNREAVLADVNGLIVPVRDADALAAGMIKLFEDGALREALSVGARRRAEEEFDERQVFRTVLSVYERELARVGRSAPQEGGKDR